MQSTKERSVLKMQFWSSMHGLLVGIRKMGSIEAVVILIFFYLCIITTSLPLQKSFPLSGGHASSSVGYGGTSSITRGSRIVSGGSTGNGESGNNGGSRSPSGQGGGALIPVYAAGAANNRHQNHHRGSGNRNQNSIGLSTLVAVTLASLLADLYHL